MRCFDELIKVDPAFPPVYNAKGMIYDKLEDYAHSHAEFSKAI